MNDYNDINGLRFRHMVWLSTFMKCEIIEIGRLQYNYHSNLKLSFLDKNKYHIELHIPGGKPLKVEEVTKSLKHVSEYIYKYFKLDPQKEIEYYCESWLFSPEIRRFLSEDSNILKFQKLFNIVEYHENVKEFMLFVFNIHNIPKDFIALKEETSLQRGMKKYLIEGNKLHIGIAVLKNGIM